MIGSVAAHWKFKLYDAYFTTGLTLVTIMLE